MVTAICNIFINSEFKLSLFKETFPRAYGASDNWLINIRGKHRAEVIQYIREAFPDFKENCIFFSDLCDNDWAKSTRKMLGYSKYDHIYVFLEDHFLLKPVEHFRNVIRDMVDSKIEYFGYSFFNVGLSTQSAEGLYPEYSKYFYAFQFDEKNIGYLRKNNRRFYPYSLASICTKKYFEDLLKVEEKLLIKVPFFVQVIMENILFFYPRNKQFWCWINKWLSLLKIRFVIYTPASPFNLERSLFDIEKEFLRVRIGGLREELFANWDDDNGLSNSSLVKRGLYPTVLKADVTSESFGVMERKAYSLSKGLIESRQFYPETSRVSKIPLKRVFVKSGLMRVFSEKESYTLKEGEEIVLHANIPHHIEAMEQLVYSVDILWK